MKISSTVTVVTRTLGDRVAIGDQVSYSTAIKGAATSNGRRYLPQLKKHGCPEWLALSGFRLRAEDDILFLHSIDGTE